MSREELKREHAQWRGKAGTGSLIKLLLESTEGKSRAPPVSLLD